MDSKDCNPETPSKRLKVVVGVNTLTSIDRAVYSNHCQFWFRLGRNCQDVDFILYHPSRMSIDRMRNDCAKTAIRENADYLLFIDDDVLIPLDTLQRLMQTKAHIAAGWTIIRGYPFDNMFFKWKDPETKRDLAKYNDPVIGADGIIEVDAVGFSCCLISVELLKKVKAPWFVTGPFNTEDIYFCMKAREQDPELRIVVDATVVTSHNLGSEYIDPMNRELYKKYIEGMNPEILEKSKEPEPPLEVQEQIEGAVPYEIVLSDALKLEDLVK